MNTLLSKPEIAEHPLFRNTSVEILKKLARNPGILLRIPERMRDIARWRKIYELIDDVNEINQPFTFLQIGAMDGIRSDPIHTRVVGNHWRGILVEPDPENYDALIRNYMGSDGLTFVRAAVTDTNEGALLYRFNGNSTQGIGAESHSVDKTIILRSAKLLGIRHPEQHVEEIRVPSLSISQLINDYHIDRIDLLVVDAEGCDEMILNGLIETHLRPSMILYENLMMSPVQQLRINNRFRTEGYDSIIMSQDTFLFRESIIANI